MKNTTELKTCPSCGGFRTLNDDEAGAECLDCGIIFTAPELPEVSKALLVRLYNAGYKAGHHDTVEGQYTDIFEVDMDSYHKDAVAEIIEGAR